MKSFGTKYMESLSKLRDFGSNQGDKEKFFGAIALFIALSMGVPKLLYFILLCISLYGFYVYYRGSVAEDESDGDEDRILSINIQLIVIILVFIHFLFHFLLGL